MTLRQQWRDERLAFSGVKASDLEFASLVGQDTDTIWTPDTFIRESRDAKVGSEKGDFSYRYSAVYLLDLR